MKFLKRQKKELEEDLHKFNVESRGISRMQVHVHLLCFKPCAECIRAHDRRAELSPRGDRA